MNPNQLFQQAQQLHQQGLLPQAENMYRQVVDLAPHLAEAKHMLGIVCSQQGKQEEGIQWVVQAIQKQPSYPPYYNNLGLMYFRLGEYEKAIEACRAATRLDPNFIDAWFNMANACKAHQQTEKAIQLYEKILKKAPGHFRAAYNLGNTLLESGKPLSARKWFEMAIKIKPDYAEAYNNLGSALDTWDEHEAAFENYQRAVKLKPDFPDAHKNLSSAYLKKGMAGEAAAELTAYLQLHPENGWEELLIANLSPVVFEDKNAIETYRSQLESTLTGYVSRELPLDITRLHELSLEPPANMPYQGRDDKAIKALFGRLFDKYLPKIQRTRPSVKQRQHIGFVVTNGHEGVFIKCMRGILNHLDTTRFDITIVCSLPHGEEILRPVITNPVIRFLGLPKRLDQALQVVAQADFDILHYWEVGTDAMNYFLPFCRLAPVQCATWGWPVTTSIPAMDYFLSCEALETPDAENHYTEKLIRFKKLPTYYYRPPVPDLLENKEAFGLPDAVPVYLVAQNLRKVHPDFDAIVKGILDKDQEGIVVFIKDKQANITALLQDRLKKACGAKAGRIVFLERMEEKKYLNLLVHAQVILDTLYYTGGANTAFDAFATGTPYVTLPSEFHRGRFGLAAYRQIGVEDAIATDVSDYIEKAVKIANDATYRNDLSQRIRDNAHKVFEDLEAVKELEDFFEDTRHRT
jgi:protein O-GlcNAc transferase